MKKEYGPMIQAVTCILQAYKAMIYVTKEVEMKAEIENLSAVIIQAYNNEFYLKGDRIDSYLERLFDILRIPRQPVLRLLCGRNVLLYLTDELRVVAVIQSILELKAAYEANPEKFLMEHKP